MCWSNNTATPIVLKKPLRVYKVGTSTTSGNFISLYQDFIYYKSRTMPTVEITPEFTRSYCPYILWFKSLSRDGFDIREGYHSYLTKETALYNRDDDEIGIFEIPAGATIYVNYKRREIVSTNIKYLGLLESQILRRQTSLNSILSNK